MSEVTDKEQTDAADDWAAALQEQRDAGKAPPQAPAAPPKAAKGPEAPSPFPKAAKGPDVAAARPAEFESFSEAGGADADEDRNLDMILDIPVTLSVEIGRTRMNIRNLLKLNQGSIVELTRLAGEPMDIFVNGTLIAHGEVVVVNDKFGIRLTDVISAAERVKKLK